MKIILLFITLILSGCSTDELTDDQKLANDIWDEIQGYESWNQTSDFTGIQMTNGSPHGDYVQIWINDIISDFFEDSSENNLLPNGSIIVKEGYSDENGSSLNNITIMKKIDSYDPNNNNWFWANFNEGGALAGKNGSESSCYNCHSLGKDYVLFKTW